MNRNNALFIVATPIGNLDDISARALAVLRDVDLIAAEDTRHSGRLLSHFGIDTSLQSYHDHSGRGREDALLERLRDGQSLALISDAGTPLISDPGFSLVKRARELGHQVVPIPGPCALIAALSASGVPSDKFSFHGFLPAKPKARRDVLAALAGSPVTLCFYESPHRIVATLEDMTEVLGASRQATIARELTKTFETFLSGSLSALVEEVLKDANQRKGEFVVLVEGVAGSVKSDEVSELGAKTLKVLARDLPLKRAAALASEIADDKKNALYKWGLENLE